ncbi:gamma-glutamyl-phosphate reductase, partial [Synechococcus sp. BA-120 BA3]|nr:gamma-glutamyl-phosphate reductase [Synechococcus sp. BA-120 BA3]
MMGAMSQTLSSPASVVPEPDPQLLQRAAAVRRAAMALGQASDTERRGAVAAGARQFG